MKNSFYIVLLGISLSCQHINKTSTPQHIIPKDTMIAILVDLSKIEAAINYSKPKFEARKVSPMDLLYEKYKIDSLLIKENMLYYAEDLDLMQDIQENVKKRLEDDKEIIDSIRNEEQEKIRMEREAFEENISVGDD